MMTRFFPDLAAFGAFMLRASVEELIADTAARGVTAAYLAKEIRERIGNESRLPPPLAQSTQDERAKKGFSPDETLLRTGDLRRSIGWEHVSPRKTVSGSTDEKAVWHELGPTNGRFPARSFIASTASEKNDEAFALYVKIFDTTFRPR